MKLKLKKVEFKNEFQRWKMQLNFKTEIANWSDIETEKLEMKPKSNQEHRRFIQRLVTSEAKVDERKNREDSR